QPGQVTIFRGFSLSLMALQLPLFRSRPDPVANLQSPEAAACSSFTSFVTLFPTCVKEHSREKRQFQGPLVSRFGAVGLGFHLPPPFRWGHPETAFEKRIEETQIAIAALKGHLDNAAFRAAEKLTRAQETQFGLAGANRCPKMFPEEAIEMPRTASTK